MKRAETILKTINDLGYELHNNYTDIEIKNAIDKLEKKGYDLSHYLIDTIYQGLVLENEEEDY